MKKIIYVLTAAVLICAALCFSAFAADSDNTEMTVRFDCSETDSNGVFTMKISFENVRFMTYQFAVRYDTEAVEAYSAESKTAAKEFSDFAKRIKHSGLNSIGELLDAENGFFDFTGFVLANASTDETSGFTMDGAQAVTDKDFVLYEMTFRKKSDKDPGFEIAFADGNGVHYDMFPEGAAIFGGPDKPYTAKAVFTYDNKEKTTEFDSVKYSSGAAPTKSQRLKNTLYMQSENYACAADGALRVIDASDKTFVPELKDGALCVPLRFVCEYFGLKTEWDAGRRCAVVSGENGKFEIYPDSGKVMSGTQQLDSAKPYINKDRVFVDFSTAAKIADVNTYAENAGEVVFAKGEEWKPERYAEKQALNNMKFVISPLIKIFA